MNGFHLPGPYDCDSDPSAEGFLEKYDTYIVALAQKKVPRNITRPGMLVDEIDELAQNTRIKLWQVLQKGHIINPRAYIQSVVHTESVNMLRKHKPVLQLPLDEDGELYQSNLMYVPGETMQDPLSELEREEMATEFIEKAVDAVLQLPPRQLQAMICSLKDHVDNLLSLLEAFLDKEVDIESIGWPEEKYEAQKLHSSLSVARKKMRNMKKSYDL